MFQRVSIVLLLIVALLFSLSVSAQSESGAIYVSADHDIQIAYPAGWHFDETKNNITNGVTELIVMGPNRLYAAWEPPWDTAMDIINKFDAETLAQGEISELELDGRPFVRFEIEAYRDPPQQIVILATILENSEPAYLIVRPVDAEATPLLPEEDIAAVLAVAPSLKTARSSLPTTLTAYNAADWHDTIRELEEKSLIATGGGRLIFQEDYAFYEGAAARLRYMARTDPVTNLVLVGTMELTTEKEEGVNCRFYGRVIEDSPDDADNQVDSRVAILLNSNHSVSIAIKHGAENYSRTVTSEVDDSFVGQVDVLALMLNDRIHLYVNGKLVLQDVQTPVYPGIFGVGINSDDPEASCEIRDIWAYEATPLVPGECLAATTSGTVNQRSGPGTSYAVAGQLRTGETQRVTGQSSSGGGLKWYQLDNGAWMREDVVTLSGDCGGLPEMNP
ncbi:MAG: SH3 domain-containing protein [Anaerolineaceae bacterium]|nr:SH3 domain-containing protein [Anaerolineaceae bacterium]